MKLHLAIDTATPLGSVALGDEKILVGEIVIGDRRHAAALVPAIEDLLRLGGRRWQDLAGIVLADGPGSFTGLRIGFATVQGLAREHPALDVRRAPSLLATAWSVLGCCNGPVAAVYDALRGEVFAAVYEFGGGRITTLLAPRLTTPEALAASGLRPCLAAGDGAVVHAALMRQWTGRAPLGPPVGAPRASALLALLSVPEATTSVADPATAEPDYGRAAEAQVRWEHQHGQPLPNPPSRSS